MKQANIVGKYKSNLKKSILIIIVIIASIFIGIELLILSGFSEKYPDNLDYIIILGAQIRVDGPSKSLSQRLNKALTYLEKNPNTNVIVSGGQGADEPISEAEGMRDYLVKKGVNEDRITMEAKSTSTKENLLYSKEFVDVSKYSIGIVSSNYHIFRATQIAKKLQYNEVYGIPANSDGGVLLYNMIREFFGLTKEVMVGNI